jgi:hypothetical protein
MTEKMVPPKDELTNEEAINALSSMAESAEASTASTGACIYIAGGKQYCNNLSQTQCNALKGSWHSGQKCP